MHMHTYPLAVARTLKRERTYYAIIAPNGAAMKTNFKFDHLPVTRTEGETKVMEDAPVLFDIENPRHYRRRSKRAMIELLQSLQNADKKKKNGLLQNAWVETFTTIHTDQPRFERGPVFIRPTRSLKRHKDAAKRTHEVKQQRRQKNREQAKHGPDPKFVNRGSQRNWQDEVRDGNLTLKPARYAKN